jgi:hypothetical protein
MDEDRARAKTFRKNVFTSIDGRVACPGDCDGHGAGHKLPSQEMI